MDWEFNKFQQLSTKGRCQKWPTFCQFSLWMAPFETFTQVQENTDLLVFRLMHGPKMVLGLETE